MIAGSAIFCYDGNGNMTQKSDGSTTSYTYDAENRMTAVSEAATATFVYDGDGNRGRVWWVESPLRISTTTGGHPPGAGGAAHGRLWPDGL